MLHDLMYFLKELLVEQEIVPYKYQNGRKVYLNRYEIQCEM